MILDKLEKSKKYINENKIPEAVNLLQEILSDNDKEFHRDAFFELGKIYYFQKEYDLAEQNIFSAFQIEKNNKNTIYLLAKILKENGKKWKAIRLFLKLRKSTYNDIKEKNEMDSEIISTFLSVEKYVSAIKYMEKYCIDDIEGKNRIYRYLLQKITLLNNSNNFIEAKKTACQSLRKLKITDKKIKNAILNELEIADNVVRLKSFPRVLTISLTEKCNLQCRMCSQNKKNGRQELSERQVNNIIKLFPFLEKVLWVGGEVFLYKGFESLMDLAHKYNVQQNITSNGLLITENYAKKIVDYGIELNLSIDSVNKEVYEFIRVGSNFDVLLKNIKNIKCYRSQKEKNSSLMLNAVLSKWNYDVKNNFSDIIMFAKEYGFDGVNIYQDAFEKDENIREKIIDLFNVNLNNLIELSKDLKIKLNNLVYSGYKHMIVVQKEDKEEKKSESIEGIRKGKTCNNFENMVVFREQKFNIKDDIVLEDYDYNNMEKEFVGLKLQIKKCLLPWKKLYISYSGNIFFECHCPNLVQLKAQNINCSNTGKVYDDIIEIWNSKELIENRQAVIEGGLNCMKNCYLNDEYRKPIGFR